MNESVKGWMGGHGRRASGEWGRINSSLGTDGGPRPPCLYLCPHHLHLFLPLPHRRALRYDGRAISYSTDVTNGNKWHIWRQLSVIVWNQHDREMWDEYRRPDQHVLPLMSILIGVIAKVSFCLNGLILLSSSCYEIMHFKQGELILVLKYKLKYSSVWLIRCQPLKNSWCFWQCKRPLL